MGNWILKLSRIFEFIPVKYYEMGGQKINHRGHSPPTELSACYARKACRSQRYTELLVDMQFFSVFLCALCGFFELFYAILKNVNNLK